ncbi:MAG: metallophosphoesterase [Gemmatimonadota bacterium]
MSTAPVAARRWVLLALAFATALAAAPLAAADSDFRILPYVQNPARDAISVLWFSETASPGSLTFSAVGSAAAAVEVRSTPQLASSLAYPPWEDATFFSGQAPAPPYRHRVRLTGLRPDTRYAYTVRQDGSTYADTLVTAPGPERQLVRFIFFADCETEPESTGKPTGWADPTGADPDRVYLLDQTRGFANNLEVIWSRRPDLVCISGDAVESGGEQRDWAEFWSHVTAVGGRNLAGRIPLLASPGNHEYYEGPSLGRYDQPGSERAIGRFLTYFDLPGNGSPVAADAGRYYRLDYGPATLIGLDVTNGLPSQSADDTNYYLLGQGEADGGNSPGFGPGTRQFAWLEEQLRDAQSRSAFTFVLFHHVPYSVGPHGWPPGSGGGDDPQSGVPVRSLVPFFHRYGVDAVVAGHDEVWERSEVEGEEMLPDGSRRPHTLQVYDVGVGGDGLRGPEPGLENPHQRFLVHSDVPEVWRDGVLVDGGKHYGHLEVDLLPLDGGSWQAVMKPVYVFPRFADGGATYLGYERRVYDDTVTLTHSGPATSVGAADAVRPTGYVLRSPYPNPFNSTVQLRYDLARTGQVRLEVYDALGRLVRRLVDASQSAGQHTAQWNGTNGSGADVASGVYLVSLRAGSWRDPAEVVLAR